VALPLVVVVSLLNQKLWQGQEVVILLSLVLSGTIKSLWGYFFLTAAIAPPLLKFCFAAFVAISDSLLASVGAIVACTLPLLTFQFCP